MEESHQAGLGGASAAPDKPWPAAIEYDHCLNVHNIETPRALLSRLLAMYRPASLLDAGCGLGFWLQACAEHGISDYLGVDGVEIPSERLRFPPAAFRRVDLRKAWDLRRRFDIALCLEVAEHIEEEFSDTLIASLVKHADRVLFSAACPGQVGQHHVNGQWPEYWQARFNRHGFACSDAFRWTIWDDARIDPWYRQNIFVAELRPRDAGGEPRIKRVVHPDLVRSIGGRRELQFLADGGRPVPTYAYIVVKALYAKIRRCLSPSRRAPPRT
jgi:hypothetical protein